MPAKQLDAIVSNTVVVMTTMPEKRAEWRQAIAGDLEQFKTRGAEWQIEVELYTVLLALLDGQPAALPEGHPYIPTLQRIQTGITDGGVDEADGENDGEIQSLLVGIPKFESAQSRD